MFFECLALFYRMTDDPVISAIFRIISFFNFFRTFWFRQFYESFVKKLGEHFLCIILIIRMFVFLGISKHETYISWRCHWFIILQPSSIINNCKLHIMSSCCQFLECLKVCLPAKHIVYPNPWFEHTSRLQKIQTSDPYISKKVHASNLCNQWLAPHQID